MEGKIVLEAVEGGLIVNAHISQVDRGDKMLLITALASSLRMSEYERFTVAGLLVDPDLTARLKRDSAVIPGAMAEWIKKRQDGGGA